MAVIIMVLLSNDRKRKCKSSYTCDSIGKGRKDERKSQADNKSEIGGKSPSSNTLINQISLIKLANHENWP